MEKDCNPWNASHHPSGNYDHLIRLSRHRPAEIAKQNTNPTVFPVYSNPYGCAFTGNGSMPFTGCGAQRFHKMASNSIPAPNPINVPLKLDSPQKGFLVFDRSGDQTNLIFSSVRPPFPNLNIGSFDLDLHATNGMNVSHAHGSTEMHEDTEEIDALLSSDSYEFHDEEEASTGNSPFNATGSTGEVSSIVPAKRRRVDKELDASLTDTASSTLVHHLESHPHQNLDNGDESSFVKVSIQQAVEEEQLSATISCGKRMKRARIRETVGVLRRIIPGGRGKDAVAVLDEAIRYLKSLKLKATAMGAATHL